MKKICLGALPFLLFSCSQTEEPEENAINYTTHIEPIVSARCTTCHGEVNPSAGLKLTTYDLVKNSAKNGTLIQRINDAANPMPQSGLLSQAERVLFDEWVKNNYKESN